MDIVAYGEYYNRAMQGIADMLLNAGNPLASFKKDKYPDAFLAYRNQYIEVIDAIEKVYQEEENPQQWLEKLSDHLVQEARRELDSIPKKSKRNDMQINYNMILAIYVFPAILEQKNQSAEPLTDRIVDKWNSEFKTAVGKATYDKIEAGFHRKFCYITTAVCESQGKPDDCYELELLRDYRDSYLLSTKEGEALVNEYYDIAPTIVNRINRSEGSARIYEEIWNSYLSPCVRLIESGEKEACREKYMDMVYELKGRYMA